MTIVDLYLQLFGKRGLQDGDVISMSEHGRGGGVSTGQGFKFTDGVPYATKVTVSGSVTYIGKANPGSLQSDAVWQCMKIDETTGTVITWANGDSNFDNVATDLTALTYS